MFLNIEEKIIFLNEWFLVNAFWLEAFQFTFQNKTKQIKKQHFILPKQLEKFSIILEKDGLCKQADIQTHWKFSIYFK